MAIRRLRVESEVDPDEPEARRMRSKLSFATVVRDALIAKSLQNVCFVMEPLFRRVVHEEVHRHLDQYHTHSLHRSLQRCIKEAEPVSSLQLIFSKQLSLPIFTGSKVEDEDKNPLQVLLIDTKTGKTFQTLDESSLKVEIVVLDGEFSARVLEDWTSDEFNKKILKEREGKRPLLVGERVSTLVNGIADIGELMLTDNSSWLRCGKFALGARVSHRNYKGPRIKEAVTEAFAVRDHRVELYKKHYPPSLGDEVWRLKNIAKDGAFHKRLAAEGIKTVQDFLKLSVVDPHHLRNILDSAMSDRMWDATISHARTCQIGETLYSYGYESFSVILSSICEAIGATISGITCTMQELNLQQKAHVQQLVLEAYQHWEKLEKANGISFSDEPLNQVHEVAPSSWHPNHQKSLSSEHHNDGFLEAGSCLVNLQVEIDSWIQEREPSIEDSLENF